MAQPTAVAATFRSPQHAARFCALVVVLLALPAIFSTLGLYSRRAAYVEAPIGAGGYTFIAKEILDERSDLDMLVMGDSVPWFGIDAVSLQHALERTDGSEVQVRSFGHSWVGLDIDYAMLRDVVARRRVKTLVLGAPAAESRQLYPHPYSRHLLPYGEDPAMVAGLSLHDRMTLYAESVLGAPRHALSFLRRWPAFEHPVQATLGSHLEDFGFDGAPYRPVPRDPPVVPAESLIYSPASAGSFVSTSTPLADYEAHFVRLIGDLARAHGIRIVVVHVPRWSDHAKLQVEERFDWSSALGVDAALVGIAPAVLFRGMTDDEIKSLYGNEHFNAAGARFFTRAIAPALLEIHHHGR